MDSNNQPNIIGNTVEVHFISFGNKTAMGKVDTGATTSCLHATNISVNKGQNTVSFYSDVISNNLVTLDLAGVQEVRSADAGGENRPLVRFDIEINGKFLKDAAFNLNDRSNMDTEILIGQNVLQAGDFQIDVSKDEEPEQTQPVAPQTNSALENEDVRAALELLAESNVTMADILKFYRTRAAESVSI